MEISLSSLSKAVEERANARHEEFIQLLLSGVAAEHIEMQNKKQKYYECDCDYCLALREYVLAKVHRHRARKRLENMFDAGQPASKTDIELDILQRYNQKVNQTDKAKENAKGSIL